MNVLKPYGALVSVAQRAVDAIVVVGVLYVANQALEHDWTWFHTAAVLAAIIGFSIGAAERRLYSSWRLSSLDHEFATVLLVWGINCCALIVAAFAIKVSSNYSRLEMVSWFLITPAVLIFARFVVRVVLRHARAAGKNTRTVAIAGAGGAAGTIIKHLEDASTFGMRLLGVFDDRAPGRIAEEGQDVSRYRGTLAELLTRARRGEIDYVFITLPMRAERRIVSLVNELADTTVSVYVIPDFFVFDLMRANSVTVGGLPAVSVYESPFDGLRGALKRTEDLILGTFFLVLAALPMLLIAVAIRLTGNESILFKQKRYGLSGRIVEVWKFRTMITSDDGAVVPQAKRNDTRVTFLGRILRATSLDELPQLFNVLSGEMSLVGPRPHAVAHNEQYRRLVHGYMLRHKVRPGITGWAQVNGWRGETNTIEKMQKRVEHDLEYLQNWSLWLDLKILFLTVAALFSRKNAY